MTTAGDARIEPRAIGEMNGRDWFGHPRGLTILFLTETWEKFSYYGMRAILVYYMTKQLGFAQRHASLVYGLYTGCAYLMPLLGAPISDRWLGRRRAVVIGGLVMAAGHFMMTFDTLLYPALATVAVGSGLYMPNLPAQIGSLYAPGDPRAKGSMNLYYVGVNLGAFLAPLGCGTLGELYGWHYGFAAAGIGMLIGLGIYLFGQRYLPAQGRAATRAARLPSGAGVWPRLALLGTITLVVVILRAGYEQIGNTLPLWADAGVDRRIGAMTIPMTWFISLNPLLVFALTPILVARWKRRAASGREMRTALKMAIGAAIIAAAYLTIALAETLADGGRVSWLWLAAYVFLLTLGELHILPVGLGLFARIAPLGLAATAVAIWYSATFLGSISAGLLGQYWSEVTPSRFFALIGAICLVPAALLPLLGRRIRDAEAGMERRELA